MGEASKPETTVLGTIEALVDILGNIEAKVVSLSDVITDQSDDIKVLAARLSALEAEAEDETEAVTPEVKVESEPDPLVIANGRRLVVPREGSITHKALILVLTKPGPWTGVRLHETLTNMGIETNAEFPDRAAANVLYRLEKAGFLQRVARSSGSFTIRKSVRDQLDGVRKAVKA